MGFTYKEIDDAEQAVVLLASALGYTKKYIIDALEDGFSSDGVIALNVQELIDELRVTFDAY